MHEGKAPVGAHAALGLAARRDFLPDSAPNPPRRSVRRRPACWDRHTAIHLLAKCLCCSETVPSRGRPETLLGASNQPHAIFSIIRCFAGIYRHSFKIFEDSVDGAASTRISVPIDFNTSPA